MNISDTERVLATHMSTNWHRTPIIWLNTPNDCDQNKEYVRFSIVYTTSENRTFGDNRITNAGFVTIQVFTPTNVGSGLAVKLGQQAIDLFENKRFEDVLTYAGNYQHIGKDADNANLYLGLSQIPFESV